jgi:nitroimidazol reductase NimA-like FMN-containing flavoprotein (pyridoxamine 5'-phosphate oxidase superfamily)
VRQIDQPSWMEYLGPPECWSLLSLHPVGRVGVLVDGAPEVYPVNHAVDGATIVFRTDPGNKLRALERSPLVCFEADGLNLDALTGWSVLVKGRAVEIVAPEELEQAERLPLRFWALGDKSHWIRIVPDEITGRRIHRPGRP